MNRILIEVDFEGGGDGALRRGALLAKREGVQIVLAYVLEEEAGGPDLAVRRRELQARFDALVDLAGVDAEARVGSGARMQGLLQIAAETAADLIVMRGHARQAVRDILAATTPNPMKSRAPPVLAVQGAPLGEYRSIMIATDLSEASARAIQCFQTLAFVTDTPVLAMHAFETPGVSVIAHTVISDAAARAEIVAETERAQLALAAFMTRLDLNAARAIIAPVEISAARTVLTSAQEHGVDLIVIGARQSTLAHWVFGSTAEEILRGADVDVLVAPTLN